MRPVKDYRLQFPKTLSTYSIAVLNFCRIKTSFRLKIDLFIVGSVAVDVTGRHIGKGEGFADLEFAMAASHHQAVGPDTVFVTTFNDAQVFENPLPGKLTYQNDSGLLYHII